MKKCRKYAQNEKFLEFLPMWAMKGKRMKTIVKIHYVLDEEDKKSIKKQMIDLELPLRKMARNLGVSSAYLCDVIKGNRYFTPKLKEQFESQGIPCVFVNLNNKE